MKLLLVDDDSVDRISTIRTLRNSGHEFEVVEADTAEKALELTSNNSFDLILLDYQLPAMNGLELLTILRNSSAKSTAVVVLSHSVDSELSIRCIDAGAQDYVAKSEVTADRLIRAIFHAQERFRMEQELRESHEKLRQLAEKDALTGLSNRYVFETGLKSALALAERQGKSVALVMLDLDKFKNINDTLGHLAGDQLLIEVSMRLQKTVRNGDLLCRLGGDEFAILVHDICNIPLVRLLTHRIITALAKPMMIANCDLVVSASIGVATYPECAADPVQLMQCADVAMYRSKDGGRNQAHFYSEALHKEIYRRVELERELYSVLERNELVVYYQPQVDSETSRVVALEALLRWQHPSKGIVSPEEFIPILEEIGIIGKVGAWVLDTACQQFSDWRQEFHELRVNLSVAVNLSAIELGQSDFTQRVEHILKKYQLAPDCLELELTESTLDKNVEASRQKLKQLTALGVKLALDNFGTGYSSLLKLQHYPFNVLKIDQSFVQFTSPQGATFLEAIHTFAKTLSLKTVAEGVETEAQRDCCQKLNFDRIQGYYFAKPMPASAFEMYLRKHYESDKHRIPGQIYNER